MPKIFIIDDDRTTVKLLQTLLEMDGYEVKTASNGQVALDMISQVRPDLCLVDYHLTDMNGVELVRQLRSDAQFAHLPVVMASGLDKEAEALGAGVNAFLVKPFEPDDLIKLFTSFLG